MHAAMQTAAQMAAKQAARAAAVQVAAQTAARQAAQTAARQAAVLAKNSHKKEFTWKLFAFPRASASSLSSRKFAFFYFASLSKKIAN